MCVNQEHLKEFNSFQFSSTYCNSQDFLQELYRNPEPVLGKTAFNSLPFRKEPREGSYEGPSCLGKVGRRGIEKENNAFVSIARVKGLVAAPARVCFVAGVWADACPVHSDVTQPLHRLAE